jgi:hypothetical protein
MSKSPKKPASKAAPHKPKEEKKLVEGTVLGPGVVKRPKRDPAAPPPHGEEIVYTPSDQVFRRR